MIRRIVGHALRLIEAALSFEEYRQAPRCELRRPASITYIRTGRRSSHGGRAH